MPRRRCAGHGSAALSICGLKAVTNFGLRPAPAPWLSRHLLNNVGASRAIGHGCMTLQCVVAVATSTTRGTRSAGATVANRQSVGTVRLTEVVSVACTSAQRVAPPLGPARMSSRLAFFGNGLDVFFFRTVTRFRTVWTPSNSDLLFSGRFGLFSGR